MIVRAESRTHDCPVLLLVIAAIVLGIFGVVIKGLLYLLLIGIAVLLGVLILAALRMRRGHGPRQAM
jgi:hypothetical protein